MTEKRGLSDYQRERFVQLREEALDQNMDDGTSVQFALDMMATLPFGKEIDDKIIRSFKDRFDFWNGYKNNPHHLKEEWPEIWKVMCEHGDWDKDLQHFILIRRTIAIYYDIFAWYCFERSLEGEVSE